MKKRVLGVFAILGVLSLLTSCAQKSDTFTGDWKLEKCTIKGVAQEAHLCTITIEGGGAATLYKVSGFSGVNKFSCTFIDGKRGKVSVDGGIMSTKMAGPIEVLEAENKVLQLLTDVERWTVIKTEAGEVLRLFDSENTLEFLRINLKGTAWVVDTIGGESVTSSSPLTIDFTSEEVATVGTGLNTLQLNYFANYAEHSLSFSQGGLTTLSSGSDADMQAEKRLLAAILQVSRCFVVGNEILFYDKKSRSGANEREDGGALLSATVLRKL